MSHRILEYPFWSQPYGDTSEVGVELGGHSVTPTSIRRRSRLPRQALHSKDVEMQWLLLSTCDKEDSFWQHLDIKETNNHPTAIDCNIDFFFPQNANLTKDPREAMVASNPFQ